MNKNLEKIYIKLLKFVNLLFFFNNFNYNI